MCRARSPGKTFVLMFADRETTTFTQRTKTVISTIFYLFFFFPDVHNILYWRVDIIHMITEKNNAFQRLLTRNKR